MTTIIESAEQYRQRLDKVKKEGACPQCGKVPMFSTVRTINLNLWGTKTKKIYTTRCSCGCLYEY